MKTFDTTRESILEQAYPIILRKGFQASGLQQILSTAGIPKGSFYHYFKSKEQFGLALIDYFIKIIWAELKVHLDRRDLSPIERLRAYFRASADLFQSMNYEGGCPIGNIAQEMSDQNPLFRNKIEGIYASTIDVFKKILNEAVSRGDLPDEFDVSGWSVFLFNSWEGSIIHMKVTRSLDPLLIFDSIVFDTLSRMKQT